MLEQFICKKCGKSRKGSHENNLKNDFVCKFCRGSAAYKQTCLKRYGVENVNKLQLVKEKKQQKNNNRTEFEKQQTLEKRKRTLLEKYGVENAAQFEDLKLKREKTCLEKYGCKHALQNKKVREKISQTNLEKYGASAPLQSDEIKIKIKQTCLERYGFENPNQSQIVKDKKKKTFLKKYGVDHPWKNKQIRDKLEKTNLKKYNVKTSLSCKSVKEKIKQTNLKRYGVENVFKSEDIQNKIKQTNLERYGTEIALKSETVREKIKQVNLEKYGFENPSSSSDVRKKAKQTCLKKYGTEYFAQCEKALENRKCNYIFEDISFDSFTELCFFVYQKDHGVNIRRYLGQGFNYTINGTEHKYFPDFEMEKDGKVTLIEIKGNQFLGENDTWQNPYDHSLDENYEAKHKCALQNNVQIIYSSECEAYELYCLKKHGTDFKEKCKWQKKKPQQ